MIYCHVLAWAQRTLKAAGHSVTNKSAQKLRRRGLNPQPDRYERQDIRAGSLILLHFLSNRFRSLRLIQVVSGAVRRKACSKTLWPFLNLLSQHSQG